MIDTTKLLILALCGVVTSLLLSYKQVGALYRKYGTFYKSYLSFSNPPTPNQSRKSSYSKKDGDPQVAAEPTPLMITPEQVKSYDDRPWRPFRWPYHQTMSIFKLEINHWLDMDKYYWHYIKEKERIWFKYGKENIDWLPEGYEPSLELMETVTDHMLKRYPLCFTLIEDRGKDGKIVKNELTEEVIDMSRPLKEHPLLYVTKMAKEDFYLVMKNPKDDLHYLVAAAVPFPGGSFGINHKIGKHLDVIHNDVPYYHEKLKTSMERWFGRLTPSSPVERASWYMTWDHKLRQNNVYKEPELTEQVKKEALTMDPKDFHVRVERQTLRRLPRTQAIIFTNHPIFYSLDEMKNEPLVPSLIRKIIYEAPEKIIKYKFFEIFRDHIAGYLDELIQRQIDMGLITKETPVKTLPTYPFAHWAEADFDYVNGGFNNPSQKPDHSKEYETSSKDD
ncbi:hypothetical protein PSN45_002694 [Yamadazyma tenuis]|uniref:HRQ family protein n=1 Tax=Candida tenuis (strain ATCC 10573 / BCRC 21748 / CBS 615 / JCM 9827 / NBRC 10315 / NRRL Y-1498 / VKM Y-70) TaxID=590646 RepID=G3AX47_CANTC|nr:uncharacterized protein CANTEDRAFT_91858 [Yamadazyma tenuis ATCC 10573]EGV66690.1 hypothetical protein CANTEDRAFT_91858 [Yamadazyma tenuis ATCC 10573]WEJ95181.1 hypothetical protein PSN45_002694 [Yamadazyma tenuis]